MSEWQPISTAPKDGTSIIILRNVPDEAAACRVVFYNGDAEFPWELEDGGCAFSAGFPTHWVPLPPPPDGG